MFQPRKRDIDEVPLTAEQTKKLGFLIKEFKPRFGNEEEMIASRLLGELLVLVQKQKVRAARYEIKRVETGKTGWGDGVIERWNIKICKGKHQLLLRLQAIYDKRKNDTGASGSAKSQSDWLCG